MEKNIQTESPDPSILIDSIRKESAKRIEDIKKKTTDEIASIEKSYKDEIDLFEKENSKEVEEEIVLEIDKLKNRAEIEKKKLHLAMIEEVIQKLIKEALVDVKVAGEEKYNDFMNNGIIRILSDIKGSRVMVRMSPKDNPLQGQLKKAVKECKYKGAVEFIEDETIKNGGFILDDPENNISFNNTFERLVYRKYDVIRKRAFHLIMEEEKKLKCEC